MRWFRLSRRVVLVGVPYVLAVSGVALTGFARDSSALILVAAALALPASVIGLPAYYLGYAVLSLIPGANPSVASGAADQNGLIEATGEPAAWFSVATTTLGVLCIAASALLNVILLEAALRARRNHRVTAGW